MKHVTHGQLSRVAGLRFYQHTTGSTGYRGPACPVPFSIHECITTEVRLQLRVTTAALLGYGPSLQCCRYQALLALLFQPISLSDLLVEQLNLNLVLGFFKNSNKFSVVQLYGKTVKAHTPGPLFD
jgi:hypothetical protein